MSQSAAPIPLTPRVGVSAFLEHEGQVLLIERGQPPNQGQLAFPGGKLKWGETLTDAVVRELYEETQVTARAIELIEAVNVFARDEQQNIIRHFVVLCFRCEWLGGQPVASDDAQAVHWLSPNEVLQRSDVSPGVHQVLRTVDLS